MTWMLTANGHAFDLKFIGSSQIEFSDIAHALAQINRFTGHCKRPYSVAEHSLLVCEIAEREGGMRDPNVLLAALMHDAHEAYTTDISAPMKQVLGTPWEETEHRVQRAVLQHFGLLTPYHAHRDLIRWADMMALRAERVALMPDKGPEWAVCRHYPPIDWPDLADAGRASFSWHDWKQAFTDRFAELSYARVMRAAELASPRPATDPHQTSGTRPWPPITGE
jgi:uncharacterized protein